MMALFCGGLDAISAMPAAASALLMSFAVDAVGTVLSTSLTMALKKGPEAGQGKHQGAPESGGTDARMENAHAGKAIARPYLMSLPTQICSNSAGCSDGLGTRLRLGLGKERRDGISPCRATAQTHCLPTRSQARLTWL